MLLNPITDGKVSGTGTIQCDSDIFGGALITADGTNDATVTVRNTNASGDIIFDVSTKAPMFIVSPIKGAQKLYYSITGTGAKAQLYEWVR